MNKPKILILAESLEEAFIDFGAGLIGTLQLHTDTVLLDYRKLYNKYGFSGMQNYIKEYIVSNKINTILYCPMPAEFDFDINFFETLRKENFFILWLGDTEHYYEVKDQYYAQSTDLVICDEFIAPYKFKQIGVNSIFFPNATDTSKYHKIENIIQDIDVSFVGNLTDKIGRKEYINFLSENQINIKTFGIDSPIGPLSHEKKIETYNRTKINLNFTGVVEITRLTKNYNINKRKKQLKGRTIEIALCGGFVLSEYAPGLEHVFEIGKEIDVFYDKEELLEKVKYYFKHKEERENIAKRGHERAIKDYDITFAIPKLLTTIEEFRIKKIYKLSKIYLDTEYVKNFSTYRIRWILKFIKSRKWKFVLEELKIIFKYRKIDLYQIRIFFIEEILDNFPRIKSVLKFIIEGNKK